MNDLSGKKFGLLTVSDYIGEAKSRGKQLWRCKCDCGNYTVVQSNHLLYGKTKSCGCLHRRKGKDSPFFKGVGELPLDYFSIIRRGAKGGGKSNRSSKEFKITIEYVWNLFLKQNRKCALSGLPISFEGTRLENKRWRTSKFTASLDRIDSTKGYVEGNVQWVHKEINIMKNDIPLSRFLNLCREIVKTHP